MRTFLVLCFISIAVAEQLGYNYSPSGAVGVGGGAVGGVHSSGSEFGGAFGSGSLLSGSGLSSGSLLSGVGLSSGVSSAGGIGSISYGNGYGTGGLSSVGGIGSSSIGNGAFFSGGLSSGVGIASAPISSGVGLINGGLSSASGLTSGSIGFDNAGLSYAGGIGSGVSSANYVAPAQVVTELNKEYYFHSAPEEVIDASSTQNAQSILKKNLRVIFIKAPENNGYANAALQIAKQATEDQTAIYVLTKQADVSDITHQLQQISEVHSKKPEVHFVKYRTQEDALNAQRTIQAQYDSLGGSSKTLNEGVAPVLNYASSNSVSNYQAGSSSQLSGSSPVLNYASGNSVSNYQGETSSQVSSSYSSGGSVSASVPTTSFAAPSGTGSISAPSSSYLTPKSSYLPPVAL